MEKILNKICQKNNFSLEFLEKISSYKYRCVWGTGEQAQKFLSIIKGYSKIDFLCDNNNDNWGKEIDGIKCISPQELEKYKKDVIIILTTGYYIEILDQLRNQGYKYTVLLSLLAFKNNLYLSTKTELQRELKEKLPKLLSICQDERSKYDIKFLIHNWLNKNVPDYTSYRRICLGTQYFDKDIIKFNQNEIFVDVGAYTGDTIFRFLQHCHKFKKIYAFELDKKNYEELLINISFFNDDIKAKIIPQNMGLWNEKKAISYSNFNTGSKIELDRQGEDGIVDKLDNLLLDEDVSFIKMDIEGAEIEAILGMKEIIKQKKPKLAICLYHEPDHLWKIPLMLKQLVPEYKIYIRHYQMDEYETVCYAIKEN